MNAIEQQFLALHLTYSCIAATICGILTIIILAGAIIVLCHGWKNNIDEPETFIFMISIISATLLLTPVYILSTNINTIIKIKVAPTIFLEENFQTEDNCC